MTTKRAVTRREFLSVSAMAAGAVALSACSSTPQTPTQAPQTAKTAAPAATQAPQAAATKAPPAAAASTPAAPNKLGRQLIGKLEGPEIVSDPAKWPKTFKEAPKLAELVKAG
ncbi:MAG: twin-arginine translocation signal domain-containing protein, partial [Chloroflexota bacterium]